MTYRVLGPLVLLPGLLIFTVAGIGAATAGDASGSAPSVEPISLPPDNPHYFLARGNPTVFITSAEHYGAVINLEFDYLAYLDTLRADGLNLTRVFTGAYREPTSDGDQNPLGPRLGKFLAP